MEKETLFANLLIARALALVGSRDRRASRCSAESQSDTSDLLELWLMALRRLCPFRKSSYECFCEKDGRLCLSQAVCLCTGLNHHPYSMFCAYVESPRQMARAPERLVFVFSFLGRRAPYVWGMTQSAECMQITKEYSSTQLISQVWIKCAGNKAMNVWYGLNYAIRS